MNPHVCRIGVNLALVVLSLLCGPRASAEEQAVLTDGSVLRGRLELDGAAAVFRSPERPAPVPAPLIRRVLRTEPPSVPRGTPPPHRVRLWGDESLSGTVEAIANDALELRTLDGQHLRVPISLVASVEHAHGEAVVLRDDFEAELPARHVAGQAARSGDRAASGDSSLRLAEPGDAVEYTLAEPVASGSFEVRFFDSAKLRADREWVAELDFASADGVRPVQVLLGWAADSYGLLTPRGPTLAVQHVARAAGWNRLGVRFSPGHLSVLIGDAVLTHGDAGVGQLRAVRFLVRTPEDEPDKGAEAAWTGYVDDLQLAETVGSAGFYQPSPNQDDAEFTNGDQLYGRIESANDRSLTIAGEFGRYEAAWRDLRGVRFAPRSCPVQRVDGQRVRATLSAGSAPDAADAEPDVLEGVLRSVSDDALRLEHPHLGAVDVRRDRLRALEFLGRGAWIAIDAGYHHFGDQVNVRLQAPYPEGTEHRWEFALDRVPDHTVLLLSVVEMESMARGARYYEELKNGELRTYLSLNGTELDPEGLNHLLPANSKGAVRLRVPVPPGLLRAGSNALRMHQVPQNDDSYDDCGVFAIGLETSAGE